MSVRLLSGFVLAVAALVVTCLASVSAPAADQPSTQLVMAKLLVTVEGVKDKEPPELQPEDVLVKVGKERVKVKHWEAAKGKYADLALFILVDDALDSSAGGLFGDVKDFIQAQPQTTLVGIAYMRSGTAAIAQDLTNDHDKAVKALRLPTGNPGTYGNPYLCLADLIKRWPNHGGRREILMITDGIDRMRHQSSRMDYMAPSTDVDTASQAAQRAGILVHSFYARGGGHMTRTNTWAANGGQSGLAKLADETGADAYFLGYSDPVSFKPYLEDLQKVLNNQYWVAFDVKPGSKPALKRVDVSTEVSGAEIVSADNVFIPAAK
jgi:hypothetical protein